MEKIGGMDYYTCRTRSAPQTSSSSASKSCCRTTSRSTTSRSSTSCSLPGDQHEQQRAQRPGR
eukprot:13175761-Heterocapsa_arctica.AAC.1